MNNNSYFENFIKYNTAENSVNVPFGQAVEYYLKNHPLLVKYSFKKSKSKQNS